MSVNIELKPNEKYCLSIQEAAEYAGIGYHRLCEIIAENPDLPFILPKGKQILIKRKPFEEWVLGLQYIQYGRLTMKNIHDIINMCVPLSRKDGY